MEAVVKMAAENGRACAVDCDDCTERADDLPGQTGLLAQFAERMFFSFGRTVGDERQAGSLLAVDLVD